MFAENFCASALGGPPEPLFDLGRQLRHPLRKPALDAGPRQPQRLHIDPCRQAFRLDLQLDLDPGAPRRRSSSSIRSMPSTIAAIAVRPMLLVGTIASSRIVAVRSRLR